MKTLFRHGLVAAETASSGAPQYLIADSDGIFIRTTNKPVVVTIAHGTKNYTETISSDVRAWPTALLNSLSGDKWLYMDLNLTSAVRTFGVTIRAPFFGPVAPANPQDRQTWYDTQTFRMKSYVMSAGAWIEVIRLFLGKVSATTGVIQHLPVGSQINVSGVAESGFIVNDGVNKAITTGNGLFLTTEDLVYVAGGKSYALKVESNYTSAKAASSIPAFYAVTLNDDGELGLATAVDVNTNIVGLSTNSAVRGERVDYVLSGKVYNSAWTWAGPNLPIYVSVAGQLTTTAIGGGAVNKPPIGRTIDATTILLIPSIGVVQYTDGSSSAPDLTEILGRLVVLETIVSEQTDAVTTLTASVTNVSTGIATLSTTVNEVAGSVTVLQTTVAGISTHVDTIQSTMIPEAPKDGKQYFRRNGTWVAYVAPVAEVEYYDINVFGEAVEDIGVFFEAIPMATLAATTTEFADWTFRAIGSGTIEVRVGTDLTNGYTIVGQAVITNGVSVFTPSITTISVTKGWSVGYVLEDGSLTSLKSTIRFKIA